MNVSSVFIDLPMYISIDKSMNPHIHLYIVCGFACCGCKCCGCCGCHGCGCCGSCGCAAVAAMAGWLSIRQGTPKFAKIQKNFWKATMSNSQGI